jgi:undecaprenyl-diphosphatase
MMNLLQVIVLAVVQGLAELLPVSSSAHVIVAEKLMGLDPSAPEMTMLLVMLHAGTMVSVIVYFWGRWQKAFFQNAQDFKRSAFLLILATLLTGVVGGTLIKVVEKWAFPGVPHAWIEQLFSRLDLIAPALAVAGLLILAAASLNKPSRATPTDGDSGMTVKQAGLIGAVQGLCLPFRGFSRSGATISTGMLAGVPSALAEDFSFALAVILTPPAIARELLRLVRMQNIQDRAILMHAMAPSLLGMVLAFIAGLAALKWLSRWLDGGRWYLFGIYCLLAASALEVLYHAGY